jgi:hypothetical protein
VIDSTVGGFEDVAKALEGMGEFALPALAAGLYTRAEAIMGDSKDNYVPVDEAILKGSGHVEQPVISGNEVSVTMGYGGPAAAYALVVHEYPDGPMPLAWSVAQFTGHGVHFHPEGRGPKYLEKPVMAAMPSLPQELAADVLAAFQRFSK